MQRTCLQLRQDRLVDTIVAFLPLAQQHPLKLCHGFGCALLSTNFPGPATLFAIGKLADTTRFSALALRFPQKQSIVILPRRNSARSSASITLRGHYQQKTSLRMKAVSRFSSPYAARHLAEGCPVSTIPLLRGHHRSSSNPGRACLISCIDGSSKRNESISVNIVVGAQQCPLSVNSVRFIT